MPARETSFPVDQRFTAVESINDMLKPWIIGIRQIQDFQQDFNTRDWNVHFIWKWPSAQSVMNGTGNYVDAASMDSFRVLHQFAGGHIEKLVIVENMIGYRDAVIDMIESYFESEQRVILEQITKLVYG